MFVSHLPPCQFPVITTDRTFHADYMLVNSTSLLFLSLKTMNDIYSSWNTFRLKELKIMMRRFTKEGEGDGGSKRLNSFLTDGDTGLPDLHARFSDSPFYGISYQ